MVTDDQPVSHVNFVAAATILPRNVSGAGTGLPMAIMLTN
jgi:hypothetical protein